VTDDDRPFRGANDGPATDHVGDDATSRHVGGTSNAAHPPPTSDLRPPTSDLRPPTERPETMRPRRHVGGTSDVATASFANRTEGHLSATYANPPAGRRLPG
jgi:hypothetical protein